MVGVEGSWAMVCDDIGGAVGHCVNNSGLTPLGVVVLLDGIEIGMPADGGIVIAACREG